MSELKDLAFTVGEYRGRLQRVQADMTKRDMDALPCHVGGVHTVKLARGTLKEVEEDCARCIRDGAPGGGYILACGDMLPTETDPAKVHAMMDAAKMAGRY